MDCIPLPIICFQCGTDQNPCHCKVVGPTLGFLTTVAMAVGLLSILTYVVSAEGLTDLVGQIVCWPASLLCCCCATDTGKEYVALDNPARKRRLVCCANGYAVSSVFRSTLGILSRMRFRFKSMERGITSRPTMMNNDGEHDPRACLVTVVSFVQVDLDVSSRVGPLRSLEQ
ncbi:hypothetical protein BJ170DRAFT_644894 [Xylariales sp. AK1849]|nr:hypothetical protein BJ170DRAFT_644894 [Xylariales sp. AK1849]